MESLPDLTGRRTLNRLTITTQRSRPLSNTLSFANKSSFHPMSYAQPVPSPKTSQPIPPTATTTPSAKFESHMSLVRELEQLRQENIELRVQQQQLMKYHQKTIDEYQKMARAALVLQSEHSNLNTLANTLRTDQERYRAAVVKLATEPHMKQLADAAKSRDEVEKTLKAEVEALTQALASEKRKTESLQDKLVVLDDYVTRVLQETAQTYAKRLEESDGAMSASFTGAPDDSTPFASLSLTLNTNTDRKSNAAAAKKKSFAFDTLPQVSEEDEDGHGGHRRDSVSMNQTSEKQKKADPKTAQDFLSTGILESMKKETDSGLTTEQWQMMTEKWVEWVGCQTCSFAPVMSIIARAQANFHTYCHPLLTLANQTRESSIVEQLGQLRDKKNGGKNADVAETHGFTQSDKIPLNAAFTTTYADVTSERTIPAHIPFAEALTRVQESLADISGAMSRQQHIVSAQRDALHEAGRLASLAIAAREKAEKVESEARAEGARARDECLALVQKVAELEEKIRVLEGNLREERVIAAYNLEKMKKELGALKQTHGAAS